MNAHNPLPEVTSYVVRIPLTSSITSHNLQAKLKAEFPELNFRFERMLDTSKLGIMLIPVMEDAYGRAHICRPPDRTTLLRIHRLFEEALFDAILT